MSIKVIIVEDDDEIRGGFISLLQSDAEFECTASYLAAEPLIDSMETIDADVILMDLKLPGMSGIHCIEKLKRSGVKSQFLVCSAYYDEDNIFDALCAGAVGYILKNTESRKFLDAIIDVYQGGSPMSGEIARKVVNSFNEKQKTKTGYQLTERENEILTYLAKGYRYKEIADIVFISVKTVRTHIRNIYEKLQVGSRMEAVNKVFGSNYSRNIQH